MAINPKEKVVRLEDILEKQANTETKAEETRNNKKQKKPKKAEIVLPKGKPKSGRIWKNERKKFSTIVKTKGIRNSFERKEQLRAELLRIKEVSRSAKAAKDAEKEAKRERRRENLKRREENRKKSEIVQVIKNTGKIKNMRRKQLRNIEKRDTTKIEK